MLKWQHIMTNVCWNKNLGNVPTHQPQHFSLTRSITHSLKLAMRETDRDVVQEKCGEAKSQGSSRSRGRSSACVFFPASNITRGRSHWKSCWKLCQLMSPAGTLLAQRGCLEHLVSLSSQRVPPLWLAGCRWCTAGSGFPSSLLHHRTCQTSILKQIPRLLYACRYKVQPKICIYIYKRKKNPSPVQYIFLLFSRSYFFWSIKIHQCSESGKVYAKLSLPLISYTSQELDTKLFSKTP